MAKRRMFSKDIVESDDFYDLSPTAQNLYFHFGMNGDDRGYVNNSKQIMKNANAKQKDLEELIKRKFVLARQGKLILIKGWCINNCIQRDRFVESRYASDLENLYYDENRSYTENVTETKCIQNVYTGKVR